MTNNKFPKPPHLFNKAQTHWKSLRSFTVYTASLVSNVLVPSHIWKRMLEEAGLLLVKTTQPPGPVVRDVPHVVRPEAWQFY